ncbi:MBOAT family protein [uncultured Subdoligranulum sp.]|mgnify:CR=1 FL=1|uniref:MBOAT family O-acyltransferase n=1 Tax=uncultured Subdoligranulum sp. TaxID=512298 RepID=UPI002608BF5D|nr:MBOAT family O-acyltransferase [uncultured Subdoligranulum sp.]
MFAVTSPGFVLFAAVLAGLWYSCAPPRRWQLMLGASVLFYLSLDWRGFVVLALCAVLVWQCALQCRSRTGWFAAGLAAALAPLLLLKYYVAAAGGLQTLTGLRLWQPQWLQPLGLGYFTLQLVSYLVDVRRGVIPAERNYARVLCYAAFFLSITQGPFNRYAELMPQFDTPNRWNADRARRGALRCFWGYFKKIAIADRASVVVSTVFASPAAFDRSQLILATVLYSFQLYADFSGYTDIVLGVGEILGLTLPENFRRPFLAATVKELWSRWHISLSRWLRDYVYFPLGGSRCAPARRDANLVLTFLVSGLWHGAGLTYLLWGFLHGAIQALENHLPWRRAITKGGKRLVGIAGTFSIFVITFTIFRASSLANAAAYFGGILHNSGHRVLSNYWELGLTTRQEQVFLFLGVVVLIAVDLIQERGVSLRDKLAAAPRPLRWLFYEAALFAFLFMGYFLGGGGFLYAHY